MLSAMWRSAVICCAAISLFAASKPDFSGKWELALDQSNFGSAEKPARMTLEASNEGSVMHSIQTTYTAQGPQTLEGNWYLDGKRHPTDKPTAGYSITKWDDDTLVNERSSNNHSYRETTRLTLSRDGKTATEKVDGKTPNGMNHLKLVWLKQD